MRGEGKDSEPRHGSKQVVYLGPLASYTHQAALSLFGHGVSFLACHTIKQVVDQVQDADSEDVVGVIPLENTLGGSVVETMDCLRTTTLQIEQETILPIAHSIMTVGEIPIDSIKKVYSHEQALLQTSTWLEKYLPLVDKVKVSSTARAAELIKSSGERGSAAICSAICENVYGLHVLESGIQNTRDNQTRFAVLRRTALPRQSTEHDKTFIRFTLPIEAQVGALAAVLDIFRSLELHLSWIESRPSTLEPWHYVFFIECRGGGYGHDGAVKTAVERAQQLCLQLRVLGTYRDKRARG